MSGSGKQPDENDVSEQTRDGRPESGQSRSTEYGQPPQAGGESPIDALQRPGPQRFLKGIAILSAVGGAAFSVMMILVMKIGGFPVLPAATQTARQAAAAAGQFQAGAGTSTAASPVQQLNAGISTTHEVIVSYMSTELAPFIAFALAILVGVLVATRMADDQQAKLATAGAGMFAGGLIIVVVSSTLISLLGPSIPQSLLSSADTTASLVGAVSPGLASAQWGTIVVNGILAGLGSGAAAAGTVYTLDNYLPA
ncbi:MULTISPECIES: hypothetical protein [Salinibaculum]|uniref:hypothetical protein n=1 Tax=Salinibaculum TaxID=2732368 RepID=UPI0030CA7F7D